MKVMLPFIDEGRRQGVRNGISVSGAGGVSRVQRGERREVRGPGGRGRRGVTQARTALAGQ